MSELQTPNYPLRNTLYELTMEASDARLDPFEAYIRLCEKVIGQDLHIEDYCSSSITSGGHARDLSLGMGEKIAKNTDSALGLGEELFAVHQLNPKTALEAVALGKLPWKQSDYMTFWLATMTGLRSSGYGVSHELESFRREFETAQRQSTLLDMSVYDDSSKSAAERAPHYFEHARTFAEVAKQHDPHPINRLVRLIDPDMSLGAQTENVFARLIGSSVCRVAVAQTGIMPNEQAMKPELFDDTQKLIRFGATVFDTTRKQQLVLVEQVE